MMPIATTGGGICLVFPDVCKIANGVPTPFPNIGQCSGASKTTKKVKICGKKCLTKKSKIPRSKGDEAGVLKGIVSSTNMDQVVYKKYSNKVKFEGSNVVRHLDMTAHNGSNANAPPGAQIAPSQVKVLAGG